MDERDGSANSTADLKMSYSINGADLHINFEGLDSETASGLKKILNGHFKRRVLIQEEAAEKEKTLSHGKASRMDDIRAFQGQRQRRMRPGPQRGFEGRTED